MRSQKLAGRAEDKHEQQRPVRAGRPWPLMSRLPNLSIRTRFSTALSLPGLAAAPAARGGSPGRGAMNHLLGATHAAARPMVTRPAETRSHLAEPLNRLWPLREPGDA